MIISKSFFSACTCIVETGNRYREIPILNHDWIESFFLKEKVVNGKDVDEIFKEAKR